MLCAALRGAARVCVRIAVLRFASLRVLLGLFPCSLCLSLSLPLASAELGFSGHLLASRRVPPGQCLNCTGEGRGERVRERAEEEMQD